MLTASLMHATHPAMTYVTVFLAIMFQLDRSNDRAGWPIPEAMGK